MALARRAGAWVDIHDRQVIGDQRRWTWLVVVGSGLGHGPLLRAKPAYGRMADIEAPANIRQGLASGTTGQCLGHLVAS